MIRDELLERLAAIPPETDIGVQFGDAYLDIADLLPWGDGRFVALRCHTADVRDVLLEWRTREPGAFPTSSSDRHG